MEIKNKNTTSLKLRSTRGFTLIELLVVIAIIGLLASIVLVALNGARQKSRDTTRLADVRQMASAFESFYNDAAAYPTGGKTDAAGSGYTSNSTTTLGSLSLGAYNISSNTYYPFTPNYIGTVPTAPNPNDGNCTSGSAGSNGFDYTTYNSGTTYTLEFCLGSATGGYSAGVHILTPSGMR